MLKNENTLREQGTSETTDRTGIILRQGFEENISSLPDFETAGNKTDKTDETDFQAVIMTIL